MAFAGYSFLHKVPVPKKYSQLLALVVSGSISGSLLANGIILSFERDEEDFFITNYLNQSSEMEDN